jgi:hypothetical protein
MFFFSMKLRDDMNKWYHSFYIDEIFHIIVISISTS